MNWLRKVVQHSFSPKREASREVEDDHRKRMEKAGLVNRVRRGHYVVRLLRVPGTPAVAEDIAFSVAAALCKVSHRIAYRSALYEHGLVVHPSRFTQVASDRRIRTETHT